MNATAAPATLKIPLRRTIPGISAQQPAHAQTPAHVEPTAPAMPGTRSADSEEEDVIPPPPVTPHGRYLCQYKRTQFWTDRETGLPSKDKNGNKRAPSVYFIVADPAEQKKQNQGKDSCFGADIELSLNFTGNFYGDTVKHLAALGCPQSTWPKNREGKTTTAMLVEHIEAMTKGKKFYLTAKSEEGKGEYKDRIFVRLKKIEPFAASAEAAPQSGARTSSVIKNNLPAPAAKVTAQGVLPTPAQEPDSDPSGDPEQPDPAGDPVEDEQPDSDTAEET